MTPHELTLPVADATLTPLERGTRALAKPPRKKQKIADSGSTQARTNSKKVKGKRGRLKLMTEIPMDILLEIFSHLQPVDVLHLSRVSKRLRDLLTSSNIRYIWTLVYENISLSLRPPACPNDVDIIHYTNYLFGRHCQLCALNFGQVRHESALIRVCSNCAKTEFCSLRKLDLDYSVKYLCIPWVIPKYGRRILRTEYNLRQREMSQAAVENRLPQYVDDRRSVIALRKTHGDVLQGWRRDVRASKRAERQRLSWPVVMPCSWPPPFGVPPPPGTSVTPAPGPGPQPTQFTLPSMFNMPMNMEMSVMNSSDLGMFEPPFMEEFDVFKTEDNINFERDFGEWFTTQAAEPNLDIK